MRFEESVFDPTEKTRLSVWRYAARFAGSRLTLNRATGRFVAG